MENQDEREDAAIEALADCFEEHLQGIIDMAIEDGVGNDTIAAAFNRLAWEWSE